MANSKAVLLVTGAWHVPHHYRKVIKLLSDSYIRTICPCLPTNNNAVPPNSTLEDDINYIRDIVTKETSQGTRLTVLAHSYGGIVATGALGDFAVSKEETPSSAGGIESIIFMAAFIPLEGESLAGIFGGQLPPYLSATPDNLLLVWTDPIGRMYNDLPAAEAQEAEEARVAHSFAAQHTPIDGTKPVAWRKVQTSYLICDNDQALPPFVQEMMIGRLQKEGVDVQQYRCSAGHSPFLSQPERVVQVVKEVMDR